ncbi:peptide chain release factor N(5)-glutamine methyltransferase [Methylocaldum sp.]|uniref:peptide chain release factor N(5)-glutamine methyltransferase n=1 Tax=Methylocaldum sp. TaxID=1969727 RepID=UPI002D69E004|nr:peptide chain release factor N(5)-glutamine methyltransferase [Methylocaldum sp.]HYE34847.1 peptide chain release factor N(5)-glutamine methyltransferase [Methylocaldum sp.]
MSTPRPAPKPDKSDSATIAAVLRSAAARLSELNDTARLDTEILLALALNRDRSHLRAWPERELLPEEQERFRDLIEQRRSGTPIAYLSGEKEFWSRAFKVRPDVLIPRPETELLIELALAFIPATQMADILDLGTGSGAIAVTVAAERPLARITATDLSTGALEVAQENAGLHGVRNIRFQLGDWFNAVQDDERFDLIVSNPPYVADDDPHLSQGDVRFEPALALKGGIHGLDAFRIIAREARDYLKPHGRLMLEHGFDQAKSLADLLTEFGYTDISHHLDLQGYARVTTARSGKRV